MTSYRGTFAAPVTGDWEVVVPDDPAPGAAALVHGCPGGPSRGWTVVGVTAGTVQLTNRVAPPGETPVDYDLVLSTRSGRLTLMVSTRKAHGRRGAFVLYGEARS